MTSRVVVATAKVQIFKQITTIFALPDVECRCCCYRKGTNFQANHNRLRLQFQSPLVVVATAKVQIFKQITTHKNKTSRKIELLLLPQRYKFSSKSQLFRCSITPGNGCCCYRKGTNFQANHNLMPSITLWVSCCCCYRKGTNFQANHNRTSQV